jgi:hypothetical protein
MGATAGDLMACHVACDWLREAGYPHEVALAPHFGDGVAWRETDPQRYSHVIFVCGPFGNGEPVTEFLRHFAGRPLIGLDLSMLDSLENWNPFDMLWERDSDRAARPDLSFLCRQPKVPVVGLCLAHRQKEYGARGRHDEANQALRCLLDGRELAVVPIDTRLEDNAGGLRTAAQVESLLARMDAVATTRLHGMVLALKNGVPALAIDPVAGGAKVRRQAESVGWPIIFDSATLEQRVLKQAFDDCLSDTARAEACRCTQSAVGTISDVRQEFIAAMERARGTQSHAARRALVAGWFSWEHFNATAGDLMAAEVACDWLREAGLPQDVALASTFPGGVDWRTVPPDRYSHLVFVCGPFRNIGPALSDFLARFAHCFRVGLDLSMLEPVGQWNPFDVLLERDSDRAARPDISFLCRQGKVPLVGLCLAHRQREYGARARHEEAHLQIRRLLDSRDLAVVPIDTKLENNAGGLRTAAEVESLLARMDVVVTTRLHGLALALQNGVPALAVDPIAGGAKVRRQAESIGWPVVLDPAELDQQALDEALDYCLTETARHEARRCASHAARSLLEVRQAFLDGLALSAAATPGR